MGGDTFEGVSIMKQRYYRTEEEFEGIRSRLKHDSCPHCMKRGCLILHGYLYGYTEDNNAEVVRRGHRIFCSNRGKGKGCGRTFSILMVCFIRNHILTAISVWEFLKNIKEEISLAEGLRRSVSTISDTGIYRIIRRFKENQVRIRTLLMEVKAPPFLKHTKDSIIQTIAHLKSSFSDSRCPVTEFQHHFQVSFF